MKRGFTLIELLVVIAIIGILSSVVLSSLSTARGRANDAKIRSDLRQLSNALNLYYDRYGTMPAGTSDAPIATSLQPLVTEGFIPSIPSSPNPNYPYRYHLYGSGSTGALVVATFQATPASTGYAGSCRPWASTVNNWCTQASTTYYCMCNPY